jgi:hypothetical protein
MIDGENNSGAANEDRKQISPEQVDTMIADTLAEHLLSHDDCRTGYTYRGYSLSTMVAAPLSGIP